MQTLHKGGCEVIDTLRVRLDRFKVLKGADFTVVPPEVKNKTGEVGGERLLWRDTEGAEVRGRKAYYNGELLNVDVDDYGVQVRCSLPKLFTSSHNFRSLDKREAVEAVEKLQTHLENVVGVKTNLLDAVPTRVDLFRNAVLTYPTNYYFPILANVAEGRRLKKRDYGETVTFFNSQRELCFYDKVYELKKMHNVDVSGFPPNVMRGELRLLKGRVVEKGLRVEDVRGLLECYDSLPEVYKGELERVVFHHGVRVRSVGNEIQQLKRMKAEGGRNAGDKVMKTFGYKYFADRYSVDEFKQIAMEVFSRFTASRMVKRFQEVKLIFGLFDTKEATSEELFNELRTKLVA